MFSHVQTVFFVGNVKSLESSLNVLHKQHLKKTQKTLTLLV